MSSPEFEELADVVRELGDDERRVLLCLARRLLMGQKHYGRLNIADDGRNWLKEAADEAADLLVYLSIAEVKAMGGKR